MKDGDYQSQLMKCDKMNDDNLNQNLAAILHELITFFDFVDSSWQIAGHGIKNCLCLISSHDTRRKQRLNDLSNQRKEQECALVHALAMTLRLSSSQVCASQDSASGRVGYLHKAAKAQSSKLRDLLASKLRQNDIKTRAENKVGKKEIKSDNLRISWLKIIDYAINTGLGLDFTRIAVF